MSEAARELLVRGVTAARANSEEEARFHLEWVLRTDADLEQKTEAWYWLSRLARDPSERRACLENVLAGCPGHPEARRDLAILDGRLDPTEIVDHRQPVAPLTPHVRLDPQDVRGYRCPRCGGAMRFDAGKRAMWCQFCGYREGAGPGPPGAGAPGQAVEERDWVAAIYTARGHRWEVPTERLCACQGCGATQVVPPGQASATCPFCGSPYVVRAAEERELIQPEGVAPFRFDAAEARRRARDWLAAQHFRPHDLDERATIAPPRPVYLPFWTFDIDGEVGWHGFVRQGEHERVREGGAAPVFYDDVLVPAGASLPEEVAAALRFDTGALVHYSPDLLAGWPAEIYRVSAADASLRARAQVVEQARATARAMADGRLHDLGVSTAELAVISYKLVLLPVWVTQYAYDGQTHRLVVNGQSGEVHGSVPRGRLQRLLATLEGL